MQTATTSSCPVAYVIIVQTDACGDTEAHHEHAQVVLEALRGRDAGDGEDGRADEVRNGQLRRRRQRLVPDTHYHSDAKFRLRDRITMTALPHCCATEDLLSLSCLTQGFWGATAGLRRSPGAGSCTALACPI